MIQLQYWSEIRKRTNVLYKVYIVHTYIRKNVFCILYNTFLRSEIFDQNCNCLITLFVNSGIDLMMAMEQQPKYVADLFNSSFFLLKNLHFITYEHWSVKGKVHSLKLEQNYDRKISGFHHAFLKSITFISLLMHSIV